MLMLIKKNLNGLQKGLVISCELKTNKVNSEQHEYNVILLESTPEGVGMVIPV